MGISDFLEELSSLSLERGTLILTDASADDFKSSLERWTDMDKQSPRAIIKPISEEDVVKVAKLAIDSSVPFVCCSGGHSKYATIGPEGLILDFKLLRTVEVDVSRMTATASAGALIGDVVSAVWEQGFMAATGTVNSVGFIPSTIGGGISALTPVQGRGCDSIVAARMVTAKGELITVSEESNPELLYAIKGAGQFFGIIVSLTVSIRPLSVLGTPNNGVWSVFLIFHASKAVQLAAELLRIKKTPRSYCIAVVSASASTSEPAIMVFGLYIGSAVDGEATFKSLLDIGPAETLQKGDVTYNHINDSFAAFEAKGGLKRWLGPGIRDIGQFEPKTMEKFVEKVREAKSSVFALEFTSDSAYDQAPFVKESAFSHHNVAAFISLMTMASEETDFKASNKVADEMLVYVRKTQSKEEYSFYGNFSREAPLQERYKGQQRIGHLRALKEKWDAGGIFTREFL